MNREEQLVYRLAVVLEITKRFRAALENNGNQYNGGLVPNLTSITDALICPFGMIERTICDHPELIPPEELLGNLRENTK